MPRRLFENHPFYGKNRGYIAIVILSVFTQTGKVRMTHNVLIIIRKTKGGIRLFLRLKLAYIRQGRKGQTGQGRVIWHVEGS